MTATSLAGLQKPAASGKIMWLDGLEIRHLVPNFSEDEFIQFCLENPSLRIEQDKHGNLIIMSPVSLDYGNHESEVSADLVIWNRKQKLGKTYSSATMFLLPDGEKRMPDAA